MLVDGPQELGLSQYHSPTKVRARVGNHRPKPLRHPTNVCSPMTGSVTLLHVCCTPPCDLLPQVRSPVSGWPIGLAVVRRGELVRPVALRLDACGGRWTVTELRWWRNETDTATTPGRDGRSS